MHGIDLEINVTVGNRRIGDSRKAIFKKIIKLTKYSMCFKILKRKFVMKNLGMT